MSNEMQSYKCIDVSEAKELIINNKVTIADIRDTGSYQEGNIPDSINLSDQNIEEFMEFNKTLTRECENYLCM